VGLGATFFQDVAAFVVTRRVGTPLKINFVNRIKYSRLVSSYVAISEHVAETLKLAGVSPARIRVIPSAVTLEEFEVGEQGSVEAAEPGAVSGAIAAGAKIRTGLGLAEGTPLVLNVGSLSKEKSQQDVLRVAGVVARTMPDALPEAGAGPLRWLERISDLEVILWCGSWDSETTSRR
jgi:glycosyltransferase involved in cell wall biosynthesis